MQTVSSPALARGGSHATSRIQTSHQRCQKSVVKSTACRAVQDRHLTSDLAIGVQSARREVLIAGAALLSSPLILTQRASAAEAGSFIKIDNLSSFQRQDQKTEFQARAQNALREVLTPSDAPACIRLALHDAATYDIVTKAGGFDGSIAINEAELSRPENATLKSLVEKLTLARNKINEEDKTGAGPISWADTIFLAGKVATQLSWADVKMSRSSTPSGGQMIATAFQNPWPVELGRIDQGEPGPNQLPPLDASVDEVRQFMLKLAQKPGASSGPFSPKPPFWERPHYLLWTAAAIDPADEEARFVAEAPQAYQDIKKGYDISKKTTTRTNFEVDFAAVYNQLCSTGAKFNKDAYLYPIPFKSLI